MQLDGTAFDEDWLESLDREAVERWRTVEKDILALDDRVERIPHLGLARFNHASSRTDVVCLLFGDELADNEWLEQLKRHHLWQATLVNLELWTSHDD